MVWIGLIVFITGFFMSVSGIIYINYLLPGIVLTVGGLVLIIWSLRRKNRRALKIFDREEQKL